MKINWGDIENSIETLRTHFPHVELLNTEHFSAFVALYHLIPSDL
jgi:hypothetical protein